MKTLTEIKAAYRAADDEIKRQERLKALLKHLHEVVRKMHILTYKSKWGEMVIFEECPEKCNKGGDVHLSFCIDRCVIKCKDYIFVSKRYPKLVSYVQELNRKYSKVIQKIEEIKRY